MSIDLTDEERIKFADWLRQEIAELDTKIAAADVMAGAFLDRYRGAMKTVLLLLDQPESAKGPEAGSFFGTLRTVAPAVLTSGSSQLDEHSVEARTGAGGQPTPVTHKDLVIATLGARAEPWVTSSQLQAEIAEVHGVHIEDKRFLPLLVGLMEEGIIKRSEKGIALAKRAR